MRIAHEPHHLRLIGIDEEVRCGGRQNGHLPWHSNRGHDRHRRPDVDIAAVCRCGRRRGTAVCIHCAGLYRITGGSPVVLILTGTRAVTLHPVVIREAPDKVYGAKELLAELIAK